MSIPNSHDQSAASQALDAEFGIILKQNMNGFVDRKLAADLAGLRQEPDPPSNNMGGTYPLPPLFLPHGEKSDVSVVKQKTKIDWCGYTSAADVEAIRLGLGVLWNNVTFARGGKGMPGYPEAQSILVDGVQFGLLGYGAAHGRTFVSLTGTACKTLTDESIGYLYEMLVLLDARLSRVDICFDFYKGEQTFDHALHAYDRGSFRRPKSPVDPEQKLVGTICGGRNLGRTMYVGKRTGEVMARIYEKGLEVFANMPQEYREMSESRELVFGQDQQFADNWLRVEVEYKRKDKDRPLPLEMLLERDQYFAGAYPYCADCLGSGDGVRPVALKSDVDVDLIKMIANAKRAYGALVHTLKELGFTDNDVVLYLSTGSNNKKLVKSGMLAKIKTRQAEILALDPDSDIPF